MDFKVFLVLLGSILFTGPSLGQSQWEDYENRRFDWDDITAMDEYVHRDDGWFSWRILESHRYDNLSVTVYNINMTSQKWMDESFSSWPYWFHMMGIAIPDEVRYPDAALLAIAGGGNTNPQPDGRRDTGSVLSSAAAFETGTVCAYMEQIPNQPIYFPNDPDNIRRTEDRIIAWTWREYLDMNVKNPDAILRLPMTKGAKRALDTIAEVAKFKAGLNITRFGVTGASKRGWTTWSVGAVDKRVVFIWPMVFSLLDMTNSCQNHFMALDGQWAWAIKDFYDVGMMKESNNPDLLGPVMDFEDMIRYAPRLTMPKVVFAGVGDEFFSPTDTHPWWHKMPGPKYFMMYANAEHTMAPHYLKLAKTLLGTWHAFARNERLPEFTWTRYETGSNPNRVGHIKACFEADYLPFRLIGFYATTANKTEGRRDFRMLIAGNRPCGYDTPNGVCEPEPHLYLWRRDELDVEDIDEDNCITYSKPQPAPDSENLWTGFLIEAQFDGPLFYPLHFSTELQMVPDRFPHPPCLEDPACHTNLV